MEVPGIYFTLCSHSKMTPECIASRASLSNDSGLVVKIWCKDFPCGDIYIEANQVADSGAVLGFANNSGYGQKGDIIYLPLQALVDPVFAFPVITKLVIDGRSISGFPIGVGRS
jgi:hypothetical protein